MPKIYIVTYTLGEDEQSEEEFGSWSSTYRIVIDRITTKKPYNESFDSYEFPSLKGVENIYVLKMEYYFGDSFGSGTTQEIILVSPYRDYLEHIKKTIENSTEEYSFSIPTYPKYGYDSFQLSNPASDYFSGIDELTIEEHPLVND